MLIDLANLNRNLFDIFYTFGEVFFNSASEDFFLVKNSAGNNGAEGGETSTRD